MTRGFDLPTYGKTRAQRFDMIRKAPAEIAKLADQLGVPVAAERLDFKRKRAELETAVGKKRARMLSSFAYSSFVEALSRACVRKSVKLVLVNPAYTSLIGLVKFAACYGSSVHAAAALAIARRAMALSERLPASGECISVLLLPATASPSRDLQGSAGGMCGRRGAGCRTDPTAQDEKTFDAKSGSINPVPGDHLHRIEVADQNQENGATPPAVKISQVAGL
jgi:IS605 OrfB family transposase